MANTTDIGSRVALGLLLLLACTRSGNQPTEAHGPCGEMDATPAAPSPGSPADDAEPEPAVTSVPNEPTLALPVSTELPPPVEETVAPGINDDYVQAKSPKRMIARLERDGREVHDQKKRIMKELAIQPGMNVADIGAGTGLFTLDLAKAVGKTGSVYAVELAPALLAHVEKKSKKAGFDNVIGVQAEGKNANLPPNTIDLAFMSDVYHHVEYPRTYMKTVLDGLRPGGVLFVIDFQRIEGESDPWRLEHVRAGKETVRQEIEDVGFELVGEREPLEEHYILQFRRPSGGGNEANAMLPSDHGAIL